MRAHLATAVFGYICILASTSPGEVHAQAFVNQATPPGGGSVYVDQVPSGARPIAPRPPAKPHVSRARSVKTEASVVEEVASVARFIPTVGAGSSAVIRSGEAREWPSVGNGTVRN